MRLTPETVAAEDYPGFVVDEFLGRRLASTIAGGVPLSVLAEATFHYADITAGERDGEGAGMDDLDAALAAGFQARLPGWPWREGPSPFAVCRSAHDERTHQHTHAVNPACSQACRDQADRARREERQHARNGAEQV